MPLESTDYYKILQVDPSADREVIEAAHKQLALKYHPDRNKSPDATVRMQELNTAREVLCNPAKRVQYDSARAAQSSSPDAKHAEERRKREEAEAAQRQAQAEVQAAQRRAEQAHRKHEEAEPAPVRTSAWRSFLNASSVKEAPKFTATTRGLWRSFLAYSAVEQRSKEQD